MIKIVIDADVVPAGCLSLIAGSAGDLMDHLGPQDVVAFTGSADTAARLRQSSGVLHKSTRFNAEADSLNAAVLGGDVEVGSDIWYKFINNVSTDITQKSGQKCTAVGRILVPESLVDAVSEQLKERLMSIVVGYPTEKRITMGPVASLSQLRDVRQGIDALSEHASIVCGGAEQVQGENAPTDKGCFVAPTLLVANDSNTAIFHTREVFGPCATILPYDGSHERALELVSKAEGCLVSSVYSDDRKWLSKVILDAASWNGRLHIVSSKVADSMMSPGTVLPSQIHGGPGRAGGGEELGGLRGLDHYTNRTAVQGDRALLNKLLAL